MKAIVFQSPDYEKKLKYPKKANCQSVLEVPKKTTLFIEWIDMDIENPKKDKCKGDYLRIKGPDGAKFYCGELNGSKLIKMGPWSKGQKNIHISFRSDNDGKRGRGVKLHLFSKSLQCPGDGTCSNQGICYLSTGTCTCNPGFQGDMCQDLQCPGDGNCSNQGICDVSTGTCTCNPGFRGDMCQYDMTKQCKK